MLKTIRYYTVVGLRFIKLSVQSWMEYPMNLAAWLLANPLQFLLGFATIKFVVQEFGTLNGWDFRQLAFLYGLAVISHGLSIILFIQTWYIGWSILDGDYDRFLLRPMNVLFQFLFMDFNLIGITDLLPGIVIFIYGCIVVEFQWTIYTALTMFFVIIGATLIRGALYLTTGSLAFFTKTVCDFSGFNLNLMDRTTMYPLTMYPRFIQILFTFLMPLGFISFFPASDFLGINGGFGFPPRYRLGHASGGRCDLYSGLFTVLCRSAPI